MLSFIQFISESILLENRIDFLKQKNRTIDTSHDEYAEHKDGPAIIDHFSSKADPTPNKSHTQWIINQYKKKDFRQEDHPRIREALSNFDKHKSKLDKKDINQYKSLSDIENAVEPHLGTMSNREQKRIVKHEGADLVHDSPTLSVHKLKTKEAACHYGAGTKWCTAAKENNMFDRYNEKGPLYVVQHKDTGEKHQYHFKTNQFMDEQDHPLGLANEVEKHPDLKNVKEFKNSSHGIYFAKDKDEFNDIFHHKLEHGSIYDKILSLHHPSITPDHINTALDDSDEYVRKTAISNPNSSVDNISKALKDKSPVVRYKAVGHPNATISHITKALDDPISSVRRTAIEHPNVTVDHISKALDNSDAVVRVIAVSNDEATSQHIMKGLGDRDEDVRLSALQNENVTPKHIAKALKDKSEIVVHSALHHKNATKENIASVLNHPDDYIRNTARSLYAKF